MHMKFSHEMAFTVILSVQAIVRKESMLQKTTTHLTVIHKGSEQQMKQMQGF